MREMNESIQDNTSSAVTSAESRLVQFRIINLLAVMLVLSFAFAIAFTFPEMLRTTIIAGTMLTLFTGLTSTSIYHHVQVVGRDR